METLMTRRTKTGYLPSAQDPEPRSEMQFEIRSDMPLRSLTAVVRAVIARINGGVNGQR